MTCALRVQLDPFPDVTCRHLPRIFQGFWGFQEAAFTCRSPLSLGAEWHSSSTRQPGDCYVNFLYDHQITISYLARSSYFAKAITASLIASSMYFARLPNHFLALSRFSTAMA